MKKQWMAKKVQMNLQMANKHSGGKTPYDQRYGN